MPGPKGNDIYHWTKIADWISFLVFIWVLVLRKFFRFSFTSNMVLFCNFPCCFLSEFHLTYSVLIWTDFHCRFQFHWHPCHDTDFVCSLTPFRLFWSQFYVHSMFILCSFSLHLRFISIWMPNSILLIHSFLVFLRIMNIPCRPSSIRGHSSPAANQIFGWTWFLFFRTVFSRSLEKYILHICLRNSKCPSV
jgi:hypothetical protein